MLRLTCSGEVGPGSRGAVVAVAADATAPADPEALEKRRLFLGGSYTRALETSAGFNAIVAGLVLQGLNPGEAAQFAERLSAVSPEAAAEVASRIVRPERASLVIVGNAATFIDDLKKLRAEVTVIKASDLDLDMASLSEAGG